MLKVYISATSRIVAKMRVAIGQLQESYEFVHFGTGTIENCDVFIGVISADLGHGDDYVDGGSNVASEIRKAYSLGLPRFMMADYKVACVHSYSKQFQKDEEKLLNRDRAEEDMMKLPNEQFEIDTRDVSAESVKVYRFAIMDGRFPVEGRIGNWVQDYHNDLSEIGQYLLFQLQDTDRIEQLVRSWHNKQEE